MTGAMGKGSVPALLTIAIVAGLLVAGRILAYSDVGRADMTPPNTQARFQSEVPPRMNRWDTSRLEAEFQAVNRSITNLESELEALSIRSTHTSYDKLRSEAETAAKQALQEQDPLLASLAGIQNPQPPGPREEEFRLRRAQISVMQNYGAPLLEMGMEEERMQNIVDAMTSLQLGDTQAPEVTSMTSETTTFGAWRDMLSEAEIAEFNAARVQRVQAYEKETMFYEIAQFAPQLTIQQREQIAEELMATYSELSSEQRSTQIGDTQRRYISAIEQSRSRLAEQFSSEDMAVIENFLEWRTLEQQRSLESMEAINSIFQAR